MAQQSKRRPENVAGEFFVDASCIDCDTCRWMAPHTFERVNGQSAVTAQPHAKDRILALEALLSCPTGSIGTVTPPREVRQVQQHFPLAIAENVFHCGFHSKKSFGAASYLIQRPSGNILVDSPRFTQTLAHRIEQMGGIQSLYLTHKDDVADHQKFHDYFGCDRMMHEADITEDTCNIERPLQGSQATQLADDLLVIPVPGHTKGHTVLLYRDQFLFTGDHLSWSDELQSLIAFRRFCWFSWERLKESMATLKHYRFEWVLPGHGRRYHADYETMQRQLQHCLDWMALN